MDKNTRIESFRKAVAGVKVIAIDADDTLWDNQSYYDRAEDVFTDTLDEYGSAEWLSAELFKTESANMPILGYGAKAVCISMMETAIRISEGRVGGDRLARIIAAVKSLLELPADPLPGVEKTLEHLRGCARWRLVLLTKGDILDQQNKIRRSGLEHFFDKVVIVPTKGAEEYRKLCEAEGICPQELLMVGNSFKSDIKPVLEVGGFGIHIPFHTTWRHEMMEEFEHPDVLRLDNFDEISKVLSCRHHYIP